MTAIGFIWMVLGWIAFTAADGGSKPEAAGEYMFLAGAVSFCTGVGIWLWRVMP